MKGQSWIFICLAVTLLFLRFAWAAGVAPSKFLFVWATSSGPGNDFLATMDIAEGSPTYGRIVASTPVDLRGGVAHHTEHEMSKAGTLFANLFRAGRTYLFDVHDPYKAKVVSQFDNFGPYLHPHSFVRLPGGNILSTFQESGHGNIEPGGIVELTPAGELVTVSPAKDPDYSGFCRPYSLAYSTKLDRIVTTCFDMHNARVTQAIQIWRLKDLQLLKTIELPNGPREVEGQNSGEPRLLSDGMTFLVGTFECGLYRIKDVTTNAPRAELVHDFKGESCALAVTIDHYWIQAVSPGFVTTLDISKPAAPKEVSRLVMEPEDDPHWVAREPNGKRIVITGGRPSKPKGLVGRVLIADIDSSGRLTLDPRLKDPKTGKHGLQLENGRPHGAVFSNP